METFSCTLRKKFWITRDRYWPTEWHSAVSWIYSPKDRNPSVLVKYKMAVVRLIVYNVLPSHVLGSKKGWSFTARNSRSSSACSLFERGDPIISSIWSTQNAKSRKSPGGIITSAPLLKVYFRAATPKGTSDTSMGLHQDLGYAFRSSWLIQLRWMRPLMAITHHIVFFAVFIASVLHPSRMIICQLVGNIIVSKSYIEMARMACVCECAENPTLRIRPRCFLFRSFP